MLPKLTSRHVLFTIMQNIVFEVMPKININLHKSAINMMRDKM